MQARDRFGNPTAWKRWQTLSVAASGPQEVGLHKLLGLKQVCKS